ncbi:hypothetical protein SEA_WILLIAMBOONE_182 [Gordonia phage WilliamBoone]|nr:hypothetical protein SEA_WILLIAMBOONE_182 [Gordonia phage WilliamBoone]
MTKNNVTKNNMLVLILDVLDLPIALVSSVVSGEYSDARREAIRAGLYSPIETADMLINTWNTAA